MNKKAATPSYRYYIRLTEQENSDFHALYERSGARNRSAFIRARIFAKPFKVITVDKASVDFCYKLTEINAQIRKIGGALQPDRAGDKQLPLGQSGAYAASKTGDLHR